MKKNFDELKLLLRTYPGEFHVIGLTETFTIPDLNLFKISGYTCSYNYGNYNRNDGVIMYVREDLQFEEKIVSVGETRVLELDIKVMGKTIKIII